LSNNFTEFVDFQTQARVTPCQVTAVESPHGEGRRSPFFVADLLKTKTRV
jgi:hypothetical protein